MFQCPVNLPFSSCCKPYVCTEVIKTHKPSFILNFTHYIDHRCLLPNSNPEPVTQESTLLHVNVDASEISLQDYEHTGIIPVDNTDIEITTSFIDTNEIFAHKSNSNSMEHEVNYTNTLPPSNETFSDNNETSNSYLVKRSLTKILSTNNKENSSENENTSVEKDYNSSSQLELESSSFEKSNFTSSESNKIIINSETKFQNTSENMFHYTSVEGNTNSYNNNLDKLNGLNPNNTWFQNDSMAENLETNNSFYSNTSLLPKILTNNSDVSEEDWTSSEMTYDTRPGLHKVVTIHPFRLFQSVELIKLNESIETSD